MRRRQPCHLQIGDAMIPDLGALLQGELRFASEPRLHLLCPVTGVRVPITADEAALLARFPGPHWVELHVAAKMLGIAPATLVALAQRGLLVSDSDAPDAQALRIVTLDTLKAHAHGAPTGPNS